MIHEYNTYKITVMSVQLQHKLTFFPSFFSINSEPSKVKQELSNSSSSSSLNGIPDLHSPKEGLSVTSDLTSLPDPSSIASSDLSIKEELHTPGDNADFPSPGASPVSESSFPKISQVYGTDEQFIPDSFTGSDGQNITVSPNIQEAKFYPETSTSEYPVPPSSTDTGPAGYYASYPSTSYPSNNYSTTPQYSGNSTSDIYPNTCVSPNYLGSYQTGKGYTWPSTTPTGVGYGAFGMSPSDVYQYQAQTAVYQQMASRYPNGYFTGQSATLPPT